MKKKRREAEKRKMKEKREKRKKKERKKKEKRESLPSLVPFSSEDSDSSECAGSSIRKKHSALGKEEVSLEMACNEIFGYLSENPFLPPSSSFDIQVTL